MLQKSLAIQSYCHGYTETHRKKNATVPMPELKTQRMLDMLDQLEDSVQWSFWPIKVFATHRISKLTEFSHTETLADLWTNGVPYTCLFRTMHVQCWQYLYLLSYDEDTNYWFSTFSIFYLCYIYRVKSILDNCGTGKSSNRLVRNNLISHHGFSLV